MDQELVHPLKGGGEVYFEGRMPLGGECGVGDLP
jgi:hypothetical protein